MLIIYGDIYMHKNTTSDISYSDTVTTRSPAPRTREIKKPGSPKFPLNKDIDRWLKHNSPITFQQLADIRYALYHLCSRAGFVVLKVFDDQFEITGRQSKLEVINNDARHYLLWRLRVWGRKNNWISALPRTRNLS